MPVENRAYTAVYIDREATIKNVHYPHPSSNGICLTRDENPDRFAYIGLGDTLTKVAAFYNLQKDSTNTTINCWKNSQLIKGKSGKLTLIVRAKFDGDNKLIRFNAHLLYKGDGTAAAKREFDKLVYENFLPCCWEGDSPVFNRNWVIYRNGSVCKLILQENLYSIEYEKRLPEMYLR